MVFLSQMILGRLGGSLGIEVLILCQHTLCVRMNKRLRRAPRPPCYTRTWYFFSWPILSGLPGLGRHFFAEGVLETKRPFLTALTITFLRFLNNIGGAPSVGSPFWFFSWSRVYGAASHNSFFIAQIGTFLSSKIAFIKKNGFICLFCITLQNSGTSCLFFAQIGVLFYEV